MNVHMQKKHTINIIEDEEEDTETEALVAKDPEDEGETEASEEDTETDACDKGETEASVANNVEQEQAEASVAKGAETEASVANNVEQEDQGETEASVANNVEQEQAEASVAKGAATEASEEPKKGNLVMVKQSTIYWPALIMDTTPAGFEVQILNTKNTIKSVSKEDVKPFIMDDSQIKGREKVSSMPSYQYNLHVPRAGRLHTPRRSCCTWTAPRHPQLISKVNTVECSAETLQQSTCIGCPGLLRPPCPARPTPGSSTLWSTPLPRQQGALVASVR
jgi:hypothetical protein